MTGCQLPPVQQPGPLQVRNQHQVQLTTLRMGPRRARAQAPGHGEAGLALDWTNMWLLDGSSGTDTIRFDGEWLRATLRAQVGILPGLDIAVGVPVMHASGGALDGFVEGWHDFFGSPDNERSDNPRDDFMVSARRGPGAGGALVYELDDHGLRLGDIPVVVSWFPFQSWLGEVPQLGDTGSGETLGLGLRGGVEFATGDDDDGFGNGGVDVGLGFVGEWTSQWCGLYAWGEYVWVHTPDRAEDAGIDYGDVPAAGVALQAGLLPGLSAIVQADWERSVLRELDQENVEGDQVMLWLGGRLALSDQMSLDVAVGEDLAREVSADVTLHAALSLSW